MSGMFEYDQTSEASQRKPVTGSPNSEDVETKEARKAQEDPVFGEEWERREAVALREALPLRPIVTLQSNGNVALLSCCHRQKWIAPCAIGEWIPCLICYRDGMMAAERLVAESYDGIESVGSE
jgi:hypothetical protein